jgi:hypothetical protein
MKKVFYLLLLPWVCWAQQTIPLTDLSAFDHPSTNWTIEQVIKAKPTDTSFQVSSGKGVLLNTLRHGKYKRTDDLKFNLNHGDIHFMMDFMLPKGANSGIYLQGRYEVQLFDSWGKKSLKFGDCGGIYERWDDARGKGNEGFEGFAPRQNACKAPGLWQSIEIDFEAPRFDASGKKIKNAIFKKVILNGILIQENIEMSGVTRGSLFSKEGPLGPITIQGDHGPVAFKNIRYETYDKPSAKLSNISYQYYEGKFPEPVIGQAIPLLKGNLAALTQKVIKARNDYLIHYVGDLEIPETDNYSFETHWTGSGVLKIDGKEYNSGAHWYTDDISATVNLTAGKHKFELLHVKDFSWGPKALGVFVKRIGAQIVPLHMRTSLPDPEPRGLIEVKANSEPVYQRSFTFHQGKKKTHVIHLGDPTGLSYSYDLKQGALLQTWKGKFLNATQMWLDRGEPQTAEPMGLNVVMDGKFPLVLSSQAQPDSVDATKLVFKGYKILHGRPVYMYDWPAASLKVEDHINPNENGTGWLRTINLIGSSAQKSNIEVVVGNSQDVVEINNGLLALQGMGYYVQWAGAPAVILNTQSSGKQVRVPLQGNSFTYQLIW